MKKNKFFHGCDKHILIKTLRIMRITLFLLVVSILQTLASESYSQKTRLSLDITNSKLVDALDEIEKLSEFYFLYNEKLIDTERVVSITVEDTKIDEILNKLFSNTDVVYTITDRKIILAPGFLLSENQQQKSVSGLVTDKFKQPLPGVTIVVSGTTIGTVTNADGKYSLSNLPEAAVLQFSFVGMKTQELEVNNQSVINVELSEVTIGIEEVVAIGYGTSNKKDLTGAVSSISSKDFNQGAVTNPLQQIAGKATGVSIYQSGSEPGVSPNVRIRGITSLIGGNDPLVVVDGIQGGMDLLNQIPPSEIESFDILKDASATAIFGSRGAPGVIVVTTKKNKAGKTSIEYNGVSSIDLLGHTMDVLNSDEYRNQLKINDVPSSVDHGANTDWVKELTRIGSTQNHTISFGGGADNFNYRASLSAILQNGIVINSNSKSYIGRLQATQKAFNNKLTISVSLNDKINYAAYSPTFTPNFINTNTSLINTAYNARPTDPIFNADGSYFTDDNVFHYLNPYAFAQTAVSDNETNDLLGSLKTDLVVAKGITLGWFGSWHKTNITQGNYIPPKSTYYYAIDMQGVAYINNNLRNEKLMNVNLELKKIIGDHKLNAIVVYEWQNQIYQGNFTQAKGFANDITTYNALQFGDINKVQPGDLSSYKNERTLISFLGRVNYEYRDKYLLTLSFRRDGSSVFGENHKWGNFPSVSGAWRIDNESFMSDQRVFTNLKLRVGYGVTGNQQGLSPQKSIELVGASGATYFGGSTVTNFVITQNSNADLRWETRYQTNAGLDVSILNNRLSCSLDAFTAKTKNLLFNYTVPQPPFPYGTIVANVGSLLNEGLEVSLEYQLIKKKNTVLTLAGNVSFLRNKVLNLDGSLNGIPLNTDYVPWGRTNSNYGGTNAFLIVGKPVGTFYVLQHKGKNEVGAETVVDQNNDGIIDQGDRSLDRIFEGSALPTHSYAFTPSFTYKKFDASMVWRGSGGNKIYNYMSQSLGYLESLGKANIDKNALSYGLFTSEYSSDLWLEDGSFLRLDNITLGYNLNLLNVKYINNIRFSLTGNNLVLITKYNGVDPEQNFGGGYGFGGDFGMYPRTKSFSLGVIVNFK